MYKRKARYMTEEGKKQFIKKKLGLIFALWLKISEKIWLRKYKWSDDTFHKIMKFIWLSDEKIEEITSNWYSEQEKIKWVQLDGYLVKYIYKPSEAVQMEAVRQNGEVIKYLYKPSEAVQLEAAKQSGELITYWSKPSEAVQMEAVKHDWWAIGDINNPSEAVQMEAVKNDRWAIAVIDNPSEAVIDYLYKNKREVFDEYFEKI